MLHSGHTPLSSKMGGGGVDTSTNSENKRLERKNTFSSEKYFQVENSFKIKKEQKNFFTGR